MRVETNWKLVRRNRRLANYLFFFSMAVLIGGFFIANTQLANPNAAQDNLSLALALLLPWVILPVGLVSTLVSVRMTNLWVRKPRPEQVIQEALKGMNKRSVLYNYFHFPARHVLVTPQGVYAMVTRYQEGRFSVDGDRWKAPGGAFRLISRLFRRDDIGNPTEEAQRAAAHVQNMLAATAPEVKVQPLIIFVDPRVQVEINNPTVPVLFADSRREPNLRDYLREQGRQQSPQEVVEVKRKGAKGAKASVLVNNTTNSVAPEEIAETLEAPFVGR